MATCWACASFCPASSQTGISLGIMRAGLPGGLAAWIGFTLPSAILMTIFAYTTSILHVSTATGWLHGLMVVAVAVVSQAVWGMARILAPDRPRATLAILAAIATLLWASGIGQVAIIVVAGITGWLFLRKIGETIPELPSPSTLVRNTITSPLLTHKSAVCLSLNG